MFPRLVEGHQSQIGIEDKHQIVDGCQGGDRSKESDSI